LKVLNSWKREAGDCTPAIFDVLNVKEIDLFRR
jgi:hypothetical protein